MKFDVASIVVLIVLALLCLLALWFFIFKVKRLKPNDLYMVDGGVKTGKSLISVMIAVKNIKKATFKYRLKCFFIKIFNRIRKWRDKPLKALPEKPMLYCNMPLYKVKYNPLTIDVILGKVRLPHGSVVLIDEATLLADSMLGMVGDKKDRHTFDEINEALTLFLKTFGHMTHGGKLIYNSQQVVDLHFSFKRNTSIYCYVARTRKFPFFCLSEVRELIHDETNDVVNVVTRDAEVDNRPLFVSKRWFKYYDRYYLDVLSKNLPLYVDYEVEKLNKRNGRKEIDEIVTLGKYKAILEYNERKSHNAKK